MKQRELVFSVLEGRKPEAMPFVPDITDWYIYNRTPKGEVRKHYPGAFIADDDALHENRGTIPEKYKDFTLMDFYRKFDWGFHAHVYDWYEVEYSGGVKCVTEEDEKIRSVYLRTPKGELVRRYQLSEDGTWGPCEHYIKNVKELDIMRVVVEGTRFVPHYERIESVIKQLGEQGQVDLVIFRSPFGKLVHEYMGFEQVIYGLFDDEAVILDFMELQKKKDMELIKLAAEGPGRIVIISDHADENLISPRLYEQYCIPFYLEAQKVLNEKGKFVSTHLDGNIKGYMPLLGKTGFDLLDGCTPAPMFNYEVEELAAAMPEGMSAFCGVPSSLFCQGLAIDEILELGGRIMKALKGRGIINVGDILPPDGDIEQVIELGEFVKRQNRG